jgi:hypothetical protein
MQWKGEDPTVASIVWKSMSAPCLGLRSNHQTKLAWLTVQPNEIEVTCSSEMLIDFQPTTWHYTPEDRTLHFS